MSGLTFNLFSCNVPAPYASQRDTYNADIQPLIQSGSTGSRHQYSEASIIVSIRTVWFGSAASSLAAVSVVL